MISPELIGQPGFAWPSRGTHCHFPPAPSALGSSPRKGGVGLVYWGARSLTWSFNRLAPPHPGMWTNRVACSFPRCSNGLSQRAGELLY